MRAQVRARSVTSVEAAIQQDYGPGWSHRISHEAEMGTGPSSLRCNRSAVELLCHVSSTGGAPPEGQASLTALTSFCRVSLASPKSMVVLGS